jgi:hypothetical protein
MQEITSCTFEPRASHLYTGESIVLTGHTSQKSISTFHIGTFFRISLARNTAIDRGTRSSRGKDSVVESHKSYLDMMHLRLELSTHNPNSCKTEVKKQEIRTLTSTGLNFLQRLHPHLVERNSMGNQGIVIIIQRQPR